MPEGKEREKGSETTFKEIIAENFPNMGKEPLTQIQEAQHPEKEKWSWRNQAPRLQTILQRTVIKTV